MHILQPAKNFLRLPTGQDFSPEVHENFKRNFIVNVIDAIFWMLGESFVSVYTILPVFASTLTDSAIVIGLVPALLNAGWFIPQILMAGYVKRLLQKMPFAKIMCFVERLPYIFLPLTAFLLPWISKEAAVILFLFVMAWRGFAGGMIALPWQEVIATVIPSPVRSRFFGFSRTLGQISGVIGSALTTVILATFAYPNNYGITFAIGGVFIWVSLIFFFQTKEPKNSSVAIDDQDSPKTSIKDDFKSYLQILNNDRNITRYLLSRVMFQIGNMAVAFLAVYGIKRFQLGDQQAAVFSGLLFFSGTLGYVILSVVGDRLGARRTLVISNLMQAFVLVLALISSNIWGIYALFMFLGFAQSGFMLGEMIMGMELGPEEDRAIYVGLTRSLPGFVILFTPLLGGFLVDQFGYPVMFIVALIATVLGFLMLLGVKERQSFVHTNN